MKDAEIIALFTRTHDISDVCETALLDLVFIVDGSGSICENDPSFRSGSCDNWRFVITFMVNIVETLGIDQGRTRVGLVLFSTDAVVRWTLQA